MSRTQSMRRTAVLTTLLAAALALPAGAEPETPPVASAPSQPATGAQADAGAEGAVVAVERLHDALIEVMKDAKGLGYEGRFTRIVGVIPETYDIGFMARLVVGRRQWSQLSEAEQERWLTIFQRLMAANYAGRFKDYNGQSFETLGDEEAGSGTRLVRTKLILPDDEDVHLNYRMREQDGEWRIIDVFLNGTVSEVALRRSEYSSVLKRDGAEKLFSVVEKKIEELKRNAG